MGRRVGRPPKPRAFNEISLEAQLERGSSFNLPPDLAAQVASYHRALDAAGIATGTVRDTLRELIRVGLSVNPEATLIMHDRVQALLHHRRWFLTRVHEFADAVSKEVRAELGMGSPRITIAGGSDAGHQE